MIFKKWYDKKQVTLQQIILKKKDHNQSRIVCNIWNDNFCNIPYFKDFEDQYQTDLMLKFVNSL